MLVLKLDATAGEDILTACKEMIRISKLLDVMVTLNFNDTMLIATPRKYVADLVNYYYQQRKPNIVEPKDSIGE